MADLVRKEGFEFSFNPKACDTCTGRCCIGASGYIWVNPQELSAIAEKLKLGSEEFIKGYLSKIGYRYSIKEIPYFDGFRCTFFDTDKKQCSIYDVRPSQCRTFPFWDHFKTNIREVKDECPGISKL